MSDFPVSPNGDSRASWPSLAIPGRWPDVGGARSNHTITEGVFRPRQELPIYCNPIALFLAVWGLMLICLCFHISYVIYPYFTTPVVIFVISITALLLGYFASTAILERDSSPDKTVAYSIDVTALWRLNLLFSVFALALIGLNWVMAGPPPLISDPSSYLTYGKLKQILFPLLTCVAVNATLDPSRLRRYLFIAFGLGVLAMYVARGIMIVTFLQMFFLLSLRSNMSRKQQYLLFLGAIAIAVAGMTIIGNLRTAHDLFIAYLQIRDKYSDYPMAFLWVVSYVSIPFSNLCWILQHGAAHGPTFAFLYSLLPSFMATSDPYADFYNNVNIIDNASTYLQAYALDFSYLGVYFANLLIGLGCGWLVLRSYPRHVLILAIFLTSMTLLFFTNMFFLLSTIIQVCLQAVVLKRCFNWRS